MRLSRRQLLGVSAALGGLAGCNALPSGTDTSTTPQSSSPTTAPGGPSVSWTAGPDLRRKRTQTTAVTLDGRIYVIGGITEENATRAMAVYDPEANDWTDATAPPKSVNHTAATVHDGRIHVFGGYTGSFLGTPPLDAHWIYDPTADSWSIGPPLPTARGALVAVTVGDRLVTIGGATANDTVSTVEIYDPSTQGWTTGESMPTAREHLSAGVIDDTVYVAGGRQGLGRMYTTTEAYDPATDTWTAKASMPTARAGVAGSALGDWLFVFGGEEIGRQVFEEVEAYDPDRDQWYQVTPLPTPRWGIGVTTLDNRIYTVGGGAAPSAEHTRTLEILTLTTEA
ncbi:MAG: kelch repeat-containing protein [Halobacteriales archaeon]|nr:kelch repeat-containing protein [Halobacteriales archaeon]